MASRKPLAASWALEPLTRDVAHSILTLLPTEDRLSCRAVAKGWYAALSAPDLWPDVHATALTMREAYGVVAASARLAQGALRTVRVQLTQHHAVDDDDWAQRLARACGASLNLLVLTGVGLAPWIALHMKENFSGDMHCLLKYDDGMMIDGMEHLKVLATPGLHVPFLHFDGMYFSDEEEEQERIMGQDMEKKTSCCSIRSKV